MSPGCQVPQWSFPPFSFGHLSHIDSRLIDNLPLLFLINFPCPWDATSPTMLRYMYWGINYGTCCPWTAVEGLITQTVVQTCQWRFTERSNGSFRDNKRHSLMVLMTDTLQYRRRECSHSLFMHHSALAKLRELRCCAELLNPSIAIQNLI